MPRTYYHVQPRYTAGSPAQVNHDIAQMVIAQERRAFFFAMSGRMGAEEQRVAQELGLHAIVVASTELSAKRVRLCDMMEDYIVDLDTKGWPWGARWVWALLFHLPSAGEWIRKSMPKNVRTVAIPADYR